MGLPLLAFGVALAGILPGMYLGKVPRAARFVVLFSGILLLGIALFGLLPELVQEIGWLRGVPVFVAGYVFLFVIDRKTELVCPGCSKRHVDTHGHIHNDCESALHGFTVPLACAAAAHAFLDGWGLSSLPLDAGAGIRVALPAAVLMHKLPEGLALGAMMKAATRTRRHAIGWAVMAEAGTLIGAFAGIALTPHLGRAWTNYPLALARVAAFSIWDITRFISAGRGREWNGSERCVLYPYRTRVQLGFGGFCRVFGGSRRVSIGLPPGYSTDQNCLFSVTSWVRFNIFHFLVFAA